MLHLSKSIATSLMASANKSLSALFNPFGLHPWLATGSWAALSLGIAYASICFGLYQRQGKLIFRPQPTLLRTPADLGFPYEDVWIPAEDGGRLHGWWMPNHYDIQGDAEEKVLLFCHGNYGNISYNTERLHFFHSLGFSIFAFDYRGYGQSISAETTAPDARPAPNEQSTYADVEMAWRYLTETRGIAPSQITTLGHSMGGAIAIHLATQPIARDMARLIVTSSFTSMEDAVKAKQIYNLFPIRQLLTEPFDSLSKVETLPMPVLYVHGDQDFDVPMPMSKRLYAASPEPKRIWIAPGAEHNDIFTELSDRYAEVIRAFYADYPAQSKSQPSPEPTPTAV